MARTPAVGSRWQHRNGNQYRVLALANTDSDNHEKYPPTVVYQGPNGKVWSRRLSDWGRSFTALPPATEPNPTPQADSQPAPVRDALDAAFEAVRKRLCAMQRYSFVLDDDGVVRRVHDRTGNWIEFDEAHALLDPVAVDAADRAARAPADSVTAPAAYSGNLEQELAMLIRRIVSSARRNCEDGSNVLKLANEAWAYLVRKGLEGSPLRDAGIESDPTPPAQAADSVTTPADGANWQDISTAPKDGTRFVAVGNNYGLYSETQHTCIAQWSRGCWMEVSEWNDASELKYLTHWMPLPPLPGSAASATADSQSAQNYPPLPTTYYLAGGVVRTWDEGHMRTYVDADRAARAQADSVTAPAGEAGLMVDRATVIEWLDANDIEVTDRQMEGLFHFAAPTPSTQTADSVLEEAASAGFFLLLPQRPKPEAPAGTVGLDWDAYSGAQMLAYGRDCSNAAIVATQKQGGAT